MLQVAEDQRLSKQYKGFIQDSSLEVQKSGQKESFAKINFLIKLIWLGNVLCKCVVWGFFLGKFNKT